MTKDKAYHRKSNVRNAIAGAVMVITSLVGTGITSSAIRIIYHVNPGLPILVPNVVINLKVAQDLMKDYTNELARITPAAYVLPYSEGFLPELIKQREDQKIENRKRTLEENLCAVERDITTMKQSGEYSRYQKALETYELYSEDKTTGKLALINMLGAIAFFGKAAYHYNKLRKSEDPIKN